MRPEVVINTVRVRYLGRATLATLVVVVGTSSSLGGRLHRLEDVYGVRLRQPRFAER